MGNIWRLKDKNRVDVYPLTHEKAVRDSDGTTLDTKLANFVTVTVDDLVNYYVKADTYTKTEVQNLIAAIKQFSYLVVNTLPTASASTMGKIYLVPAASAGTGNTKDEFITIESSGSYSWEQIGSTAVDLSGYVTTTALNSALSSYLTATQTLNSIDTKLAAALVDYVASDDYDNVVKLTQAQYDALQTKDARKVYIVTDTTVPSDHVGVAKIEQTTTSTADGGTNVITCTLTNDVTTTFSIKNGNQGNSGYTGAAEELEVVNNLTDGGSTKALSAEMGKTLEGEVSQLGHEVDNLQNGSQKNYTGGAYLKSDFTTADNSAWGYTDYIPYTSGNAVSWKFSDGTKVNSACLLFYNSSKQKINGAYWGANTNNGIKEITSSEITQYAANAAYLRASFVLTEGSYVKIAGTTVWTKQENVTGIAQLEEEIDLTRTGVEQNYVGGAYLDSNGNPSINSAWGITEFIEYPTGSQIVWKYSNGTYKGGASLVFYNSSKQRIQDAYWGANSNTGSRTISASDISTYAPNAAYFKASFVLNEDASIGTGSVTLWTPQDSVDGIDILRSDLNALATETDPDGIVTLNKFKGAAIAGIGAKIGEQMPKAKDKYLTIVHASDLHGDVGRTKRIIDFVNANSNIKGIIFSGDMAQSTWADQGFEETFGAYYDKTSAAVFPLVGNHEIGNRKTIQDNSNSAVGARFITPYMSRLGGVQGATNSGYYYKDFSTEKIRFIVLNEYETPRIPNSGETELKYSIWDRYLSQDQCDWLVTTLNSVSSGWSVVVCMHQIIDVFPKYDNEFKGTVAYGSADVSNAGQDTLIQDVIDAYIGRTTLSKTYSHTSASASEIPSVTISANFSSAQGDFICYINGHTHNDGNGQSSIATHKQVNLNITCGSNNTNSIAVYDDLFRDSSGISQDAFNVIAFDTDKKQIRVLRIGANVSMDMRRRDYALIPYAQS